MNRPLLFLLLLLAGNHLHAQKVDSIYFHLYTDSLKKGQHNYINVDGKMSNGTWKPLTAKELEFSCVQGTLEGNELFIPEDFKPASVTVKAVLKSNPAVWKEVTIWIKTMPDPPLPTEKDVRRKRGKG